MKTFLEWVLREDNLARTYDTRAFASLPWDWKAMMGAKVIQPLFWYAKGNYVDGKPEVMGDYSASIITLPNLRSIPKNELSAKNIHTGNPPEMNSFMSLLLNPEAWYDGKIDQVYEGIKMIGKRPEDFGGMDIRPASPQIK
jgi:hypothetical protein